MSNALVPELAVRDAARSLVFYRDVLGFSVVYERPEEGFAFLRLGRAELMIDQIGLGRTFMLRDAPLVPPLGRGLNLQIRVEDVVALLRAVEAAGLSPYLPLEEKWYRRGDTRLGQRQFVVADPDGYLLRLCEEVGTEPAA